MATDTLTMSHLISVYDGYGYSKYITQATQTAHASEHDALHAMSGSCGAFVLVELDEKCATRKTSIGTSVTSNEVLFAELSNTNVIYSAPSKTVADAFVKQKEWNLTEVGIVHHVASPAAVLKEAEQKLLLLQKGKVNARSTFLVQRLGWPLSTTQYPHVALVMALEDLTGSDTRHITGLVRECELRAPTKLIAVSASLS